MLITDKSHLLNLPLQYSLHQTRDEEIKKCLDEGLTYYFSTFNFMTVRNQTYNFQQESKISAKNKVYSCSVLFKCTNLIGPIEADTHFL